MNYKEEIERRLTQINADKKEEICVYHGNLRPIFLKKTALLIRPYFSLIQPHNSLKPVARRW